MKKILIASIVALSMIGCGVAIFPDDNMTVTKIIKQKDGCKYIINVPLSNDIELDRYPCGCFDVGDTVKIAKK